MTRGGPKRILALDLARRTGWACCGERDDAGPPLHGCWKLPGLLPETIDAAHSQLFDLVQAMIRQQRIDVLVVEALNQGTVSRPGMGLAHRALPTVACLAAVRLGVQRYEVATSTWRKHFLGRGDLGGDEAKRRAVTLCCQLGPGWACTDHNEAEAQGIYAYAKSILQPGWAYRSTPLFA